MYSSYIIGILEARQTFNISRTLLGNKSSITQMLLEQRLSIYMFIIGLKPGFSGLGKANCKTIEETSKFWDLVRVILGSWRYIPYK